MKLKIITPDALVFDEDVLSVTLPGTEGEMTILPRHAALLATLKKGPVRYRQHERLVSDTTIEAGFVEVLKDEVLVMTKAVSTSPASPSHH